MSGGIASTNPTNIVSIPDIRVGKIPTIAERTPGAAATNAFTRETAPFTTEGSNWFIISGTFEAISGISFSTTFEIPSST